MDKASGSRDTSARGARASGRRVLLATDGSLASVAATLSAIELGRERGAELHVVHVTTPDSDLQVEFGESSLDALDSHPVDGLEAARYLAAKAGVEVRLHEKRGSVVDSILEVARHVGAETIVMGETGPRTFGRTGVGSVAKAVQAHCSDREVIILAGHSAEVVAVIKEIFAADSAALPGAASVDPDVDWAAMVREPAFRDLLSMKARFVVPVIVVALSFYLAINVLAGFAPGLMNQSVAGAFSLGYVLIIAVYVMTWIIALAYVRIANRSFDKQAAEAVAALERWKKNR